MALLADGYIFVVRTCCAVVTYNKCSYIVKLFILHLLNSWWDKIFLVGAHTTTLPTFTCSASSNHNNIIHEVTKYCSTTNVLSIPRKLPVIR